jgi:hypothetical protein
MCSVTRHGVWIGNCIYCTVTIRRYNLVLAIKKDCSSQRIPTADVPLLLGTRTRRLANISSVNSRMTPLTGSQLVKARVTLRPTINRSVTPGFEPHVGLVTGH